VRDAGNLLTRADLALPTVDVDTFVLNYPSPGHLMTHLRAMGEGSALAARRRALSRPLALAAAAAYQGMFPAEGGEGVAATYQVRGPAAPRPCVCEGRGCTSCVLRGHGALGIAPGGPQPRRRPPHTEIPLACARLKLKWVACPPTHHYHDPSLSPPRATPTRR
jgi:hypothetical protein